MVGCPLRQLVERLAADKGRHIAARHLHLGKERGHFAVGVEDKAAGAVLELRPWANAIAHDVAAESAAQLVARLNIYEQAGDVALGPLHAALPCLGEPSGRTAQRTEDSTGSQHLTGALWVIAGHGARNERHVGRHALRHARCRVLGQASSLHEAVIAQFAENGASCRRQRLVLGQPCRR